MRGVDAAEAMIIMKTCLTLFTPSPASNGRGGHSTARATTTRRAWRRVGRHGFSWRLPTRARPGASSRAEEDDNTHAYASKGLLKKGGRAYAWEEEEAHGKENTEKDSYTLAVVRLPHTILNICKDGEMCVAMCKKKKRKDVLVPCMACA